uniref:Condensin complex subunit 2 n=1 Tax=Strongyloides stercoralis TaxID=6248 RepID=A0A0K0E359_STRER
MEVEDENSHLIRKFQECLRNPDSKEEVSELVLDVEEIAKKMAKKKITVDPHIFTKWIVDLGVKTSNLEQGIRLLLAGIQMNFISINLLEGDVNAFRELICYDQKAKDNEKDEETLRKEKAHKKQREAERKKAKWTVICDNILQKYESEKSECSIQRNFDVGKEFLKACASGVEDPFEAVFEEHKFFIDERLNKLKKPQQAVKIKKQKRKIEKKKVEQVHFDDAYFEVATSSYEEGNVRGLISLNAKRDVRGRVLKINGKCDFKPKQHEIGKPSWFIRDFYKVTCECLKEAPSKELYRVHSCFPTPPYNTDEPSGFIFDNYIPFVPEVPSEDSARIYADCMYINGLSEEDALDIYGIDKDLLENLKKLTKGEGNFVEVMERLKNAVPKERLRKLIWFDETFDITNKDNLDKIYNPYHNFETIDMIFVPDLTRFEEMKHGKFRKIIEPNGGTKVFFGRKVIPETSKDSTRKSQMFESSEYFDITQQIHDLSMANEDCNASQIEEVDEGEEIDNGDDLDISFLSRNSMLSFADVSNLEESIKRNTDVMEFSQLPRGVDQSHWKYKTGSTKKLPRPKSSLSNRTSPKSRKRASSTSLSQITPKSSRVLRSQTKSVVESGLPKIKEEVNDNVTVEDEDDIDSEPRRIPDSDAEGEPTIQHIKKEILSQSVGEESTQQCTEENEDPSHQSDSHSDNVEEQQSTRYRDNDDEFFDLDMPSKSDGEESYRSAKSAPMEIDELSPINSESEDTLMDESSDRTIKCDTPPIEEGDGKAESPSKTKKPSQDIVKQSVSVLCNETDYFGPFGNIYDDDDFEPLFLTQNVPQGYTNVVTEEDAHSFGYMAMKYSENASKIKCTTSISYVNAPLIKLAIIDVLSNSSLNDANWESFNYIMSLAKTGNFRNLDHQALREPFKKCMIFKSALENLTSSFKSTFKTRVKEAFPTDIVINDRHTLRSIFYCISQIIPQSKDNKLHYLTFVNLLLHMNNKFEMTFIDPSTNEEPNGEAPVTCYVKKHTKD